MKRQQAHVAEITTAMPMTRDCVSDIRNIIVLARRSVVRHINTTMTLAYWLIGRRIVVEEQKGSKRAAYGERLLERISRELSSEFGNGFGEPHLRNCRLFYKAYPTEAEIRYTLCIKLSWSHHRLIMRVPEPKARQYYLKEAEEQSWDTTYSSSERVRTTVRRLFGGAESVDLQTSGTVKTEKNEKGNCNV